MCSGVDIVVSKVDVRVPGTSIAYRERKSRTGNVNHVAGTMAGARLPPATIMNHSTSTPRCGWSRPPAPEPDPFCPTGAGLPRRTAPSGADHCGDPSPVAALRLPPAIVGSRLRREGSACQRIATNTRHHLRNLCTSHRRAPGASRHPLPVGLYY